MVVVVVLVVVVVVEVVVSSSTNPSHLAPFGGLLHEQDFLLQLHLKN